MRYYILISITFLFFACNSGNSSKKNSGISLFGINELEKNVATIKIERFEDDLFKVNIDSLDTEIPKLRKKYKEMFDIFSFKMVNLGDPAEEVYANEFTRFVTDYYMNLNYKEVKKVYPNVDNISKQLSEAFTIYKQIFPDKKIPRVYTCISGWNQSIVTSDTILGIALDKYLGRESDIYKRLQYNVYQTYTLQENYIVSDCMRGWAYTQFEFNDSVNNTLLSNMLYEGKILYFIKEMMPNTPDSIIIGFKPQQIEWCKQNNAEMWTYLIENKLLFTSKFIDIRKLIYPAPFTSFFGKQSPGRATVWIGWQIINSYMKNNDVSLNQLLADNDYNKILRLAKFKP